MEQQQQQQQPQQKEPPRESSEDANRPRTSTVAAASQHDTEDPAHTEAWDELLPSTSDPRADNGEDRKGDRGDDEGQVDTGQTAEGVPHGMPVDRGWAWVVLVALFVIMFVTGSFILAQSVLLMEYVSLFQISVTTAAAPLGITIGCAGFGNVLVANVLMPRVGTRTLVFLGALIYSLSIAILFLAPNMAFVCVVHVFIGLTMAVITLPSMTLLNYYFRARRSLAMSIANTGFSVCVFVAPPLVQYLISMYGARGTLLLLAGISLHMAVAACLLRPVSAYSTKAGKARETHLGRIRERSASGSRSLLDEASERAPCRNRNSNNVSSSSKRDQSQSEMEGVITARFTDGRGGEEEKEAEEAETRISAEEESETPQAVTNPRVRSDENCHLVSYNDDQGNNGSSADKTCAQRPQTSPLPEKTRQPNPGQGGTLLMDGSQNRAQANHDLKATVGKTGGEDGDAVQESAGGGRRGQAGVEEVGRRSCWRRVLGVLAEVFAVSLFRSRLFLLIITYVPLGMSTSLSSIYLPSLGVSKGLSREEAALLLTVLGAVGLVSRLVVGYVADLNLVKKTHIVAVSTFVVGVTTLFNRLYHNFELLAMFAAIQGIFGGVVHNLLAVVVIDLMGLQVMSKVLGMTFLIHSLWSAANYPFVGALVDMTKSYYVPFYYIAACQLLATFIVLLEPVARRLESKRIRRFENDVVCRESPVQA